MENEKIIKKLLDTIDSSVNGFSSSMSGLDHQLYEEVMVLIKDMDLAPDKTILNNAKNISIIGKVKLKINQIVRSKEFNNNVEGLLSSLNDITAVQHQYFESIHDGYSPSQKLAELQQQTISDTVDALKGNGMKQPITEKVQDILRTNTKEGKSYTGLLSEMKEYLVENDGAMVRYSKQISTDTLNTYAATYNDLVSNDLGLKWYRYTGVLIKTSRAICKACVAKDFIHESEFADVVVGGFEEFRDINGKINPETDLPYGMIEGTNASNFQQRRGGYQCNHLLLPTSAALVPKQLRAKFPD